MKRRLLALLSLLVLVGAALFAPAVSAIDATSKVCQSAPQGSAVCDPNSKGRDVVTGNDSIVLQGVRILTIIIGVAAVFAIIFGGIRFMTAHGDPSSINTAKNTILYAVVGIVVVLVAQSLVIFVINRL